MDIKLTSHTYYKEQKTKQSSVANLGYMLSTSSAIFFQADFSCSIAVDREMAEKGNDKEKQRLVS